MEQEIKALTEKLQSKYFLNCSILLESGLWNPIARTSLGTFNFQTTGTFKIPDVVPESASEVYISAFLQCSAIPNNIVDVTVSFFF